MDKVDLAILSILEKDSRISYADLADRVGLSKTPCWNRVKRMEDDKLISSYRTILDHHKLGLQVSALVHVVIDFAQADAFEKAVLKHASILRCLAVTGEFDYLLEIAAIDMMEFDTLLRVNLSRLPGVQRFSTSISTREVKGIDHTSTLDLLTK